MACSRLPTDLSFDHGRGRREPDSPSDGHRCFVLGVHMSNHGVNALLSQPRHHELCCFPGVALTLVRCTDHPRDLGGQPFLLLADGGLDSAKRLGVLAVAYQPVEPALRTILRSTHQLTPVTSPQLNWIGRFAAGEGVQQRVAQHRRELIGVLDAQRLQGHPLAVQDRSLDPVPDRRHRRHGSAQLPTDWRVADECARSRILGFSR